MKNLQNFKSTCGKAILITSIGLLLTSNVTGQTQAQKLQIQSETNVVHLNQLAADFSATAIQEKAAAEQWAIANGFPIRGTTPDGSYFEIQSIVNGPAYYITNNINAANTIATNKVWSGGGAGLNLSGLGYTIGEWDGPIVELTQYSIISTEFGTRLTQIDIDPNPPDLNNTFPHPIHVAGTMIATGTSANARGMANQAEITLYDWTGAEGEMADEAANNNMLFSNHSYGSTRGWLRAKINNVWSDVWFGNRNINQTEDYSFGFYDNSTQQWDVIANDAPYYLIVKSAGNDRGESPPDGNNGTSGHWAANYDANGNFLGTVTSGFTTFRETDGGADGYDCLDQQGVAKNILTVGAVDDIPAGYSSSSDVKQINLILVVGVQLSR